MDEIKRKVYTYGGYEELWSEDYKLKISYQRPREYEMNLRNGVWESDLLLNPLMLRYLRSSAAFSYAAELCDSFGIALNEIGRFIPEDGNFLPEELFRLLMDDRGLSMEEALGIVIDTFGEKLIGYAENDLLRDIQPRTAAVNRLLLELIHTRSTLIHKPYEAKFRSPLGAVEKDTPLELSVIALGNVQGVTLKLWSEGFSRYIPMERSGDRFFCRFEAPSPAVYFYSFVHDGIETEGFQLTVYEKGFETPEWIKGSIMYQIFPDRFGLGEDVSEGIEYHRALGQTPELHENASEPVKWTAREGEKDYSPDDFYGGTLRGIAKRLPYLKSLGVGVLYLNPIVEARSNHRYDTSDYERVDPILGSNEDYVNLCAEAERLGIRIINDGVFSHTGADSRYFNRYGNYGEVGACQGEASQYFSWYDFKSFPDRYRCWWGFKELPEVNELNPAWQDYIVSDEDSIVKRWLKMGASGWRLDVADELPDEVLCLIRRAVKSEKSDAVIIGEVWEDAVLKQEGDYRRRYALGDALDSVMNYPFRDAVLSFALGKTSSYELKEFLLHQRYTYPKPMYDSLMNLLSSHDVERLHTYLALGGDCKGMSRDEQVSLHFDAENSAAVARKQMLCAAIQYSVPGVPCLYYGDEECLDGGRDPFNRAPFEPKRKKLYSFYERLGEIRNGSSALRNGEISIKTPSPEIIIIMRESAEEVAFCVVNRSSYPIEWQKGVPQLSVKNKVSPMSAEIFIEKQ